MVGLKFKDNELTGVDINPLVKELENEETKFYVADVKKLPFKENSFDIIFCLDMLEHIKGLNKALLELKRVLRPRGSLLVSIPEENSLYKIARLFLKGTLSNIEGPASSPHYWTSKQLQRKLSGQFMSQKQKALYHPFVFFRIIRYVNKK